jgi:hypothetical protein
VTAVNPVLDSLTSAVLIGWVYIVKKAGLKDDRSTAAALRDRREAR